MICDLVGNKVKLEFNLKRSSFSLFPKSTLTLLFVTMYLTITSRERPKSAPRSRHKTVPRGRESIFE